MFFFNKKTPEEKEAERIEKMRRKEGERGFSGALMTPIGELALADICLVRLMPEQQLVKVSCLNRIYEIPYPNMRGMVVSSENQIVNGESAITLAEINTLLENGVDQFIGPLEGNARQARWFIRLDYVDAENQPCSLMMIAYSMQGFYRSTSRLYATTQFEENLVDIMSRYQPALPDNH